MTWDTTGQPHTGDYLLTIVQEAVAKLKEETTAQVVGVVTDNAQRLFLNIFSINFPLQRRPSGK